jgi:hypothetical protein
MKFFAKNLDRELFLWVFFPEFSLGYSSSIRHLLTLFRDFWGGRRAWLGFTLAMFCSKFKRNSLIQYKLSHQRYSLIQILTYTRPKKDKIVSIHKIVFRWFTIKITILGSPGLWGATLDWIEELSFKPLCLNKVDQRLPAKVIENKISKGAAKLSNCYIIDYRYF